MIQIRRVLACDGKDCGAVSLSVLQTVDADQADWQGWEPIRDEADPIGDTIKHLCPECVRAGNTV